MSEQKPSLISIAKTISEAASALAAQLEKHGISGPSFSEDGLEEYPKLPELVGPRFQLIDAAADMLRLALGPNDAAFMNPVFLNYDATITDVLNEFDFWAAVPLAGSATLDEIATRVNLPQSLVRRVLKYAISIRLFARSPDAPEKIMHTSFSAVLAKKALLRTWTRHNFREVRPGTVYLAESFRKFSAGKNIPSQEASEAGFTLANVDRLDKLESFWDYIGREEEGKPKGYRTAKFAESMQAAASASAIKTEDLLITGYDWAKLGEVTVVDIGGSSGHDALHLARTYPNLKVVVQDIAEVEASFNEKVPQDLRSRITFQAHNFFKPQETQGAVYMLKMILHDWSDKYAAQILTSLLPQLKLGSRLLMVEAVVPPDEAPIPFATPVRLMAGVDLQMLIAFNSLERRLVDWEALLRKVDKGLKITYVSDVPGALNNFIEVKYEN